VTHAATGYSASSGNLSVSAYITSGGSCWVSGQQNIAFAPLDPFNPVNVQATGNVRVTCWGLSNTFTVGVTQVTPSPLLLINGSNSIPYTLDLPTSATARVFILGSITIPITAHIQGNDYRFAPAGAYTDTVTLQITP
jgi:spore coat protein U-like protein